MPQPPKARPFSRGYQFYSNADLPTSYADLAVDPAAMMSQQPTPPSNEDIAAGVEAMRMSNGGMLGNFLFNSGQDAAEYLRQDQTGGMSFVPGGSPMADIIGPVAANAIGGLGWLGNQVSDSAAVRDAYLYGEDAVESAAEGNWFDMSANAQKGIISLMGITPFARGPAKAGIKLVDELTGVAAKQTDNLADAGTLNAVTDAASGIKNTVDDVAAKAEPPVGGEELAKAVENVSESPAKLVREANDFWPGPKDRIRNDLAEQRAQDIPLAPKIEDNLAEQRLALPDEVKDLPDYMTSAEQRIFGKVEPSFVVRLAREGFKPRELMAAVLVGMSKRRWYEHSAGAISAVFGKDAPRFTFLLAALSPQTSVEMNLKNSLMVWRNWRAHLAAGGASTPEEALRVIRESIPPGANSGKPHGSLRAWEPNGVAALTGNIDDLTLSGAKVDSFAWNLMHLPKTVAKKLKSLFSVTVDAHQSKGARIGQDRMGGAQTKAKLAKGDPGITPEYAWVAAMHRKVGDLLGMDPREVQETAWSTYKAVTDWIAEKSGRSAKRALVDGEVTAEQIAGTVDFATLLKDPNYRNLLGDEYARAIDDLQPTRKPGETPELGGDLKKWVEVVAEALDTHVNTNLTDSAAKKGAWLKDPNKVIATTSFEQAPSIGSGHMSKFHRLPQKIRDQWSNKFGQVWRTLRGTDELNDAAFPGGAGGTPMPGQGAFIDDQGRATYNVVHGIPTQVDVVDGAVDPLQQQALLGLNYVRGMLGVQDGVNTNAFIADNTYGPMPSYSTGAAYKTKGKITPDTAKAVLRAVGPETALQDTGYGVNLFNYATGAPVPGDVVEGVRRLFGKKTKSAQTRNLMEMGYADLSELWKKPEGKREVVNFVLGRLDELWKNTDLMTRIDPGTRRIAGELHDTIMQLAKSRGIKPRSDVMNMLRILRDGGWDALRKAAGDPKQLLPVLMAAGLGPAFVAMLNGDMSNEPGAQASPGSL